MRDPNRIALMVRTLEELWRLEPDQRLGQLVNNTVRIRYPELNTHCSQLALVEDNLMLEAIQSYLTSLKTERVLGKLRDWEVKKSPPQQHLAKSEPLHTEALQSALDRAKQVHAETRDFLLSAAHIGYGIVKARAFATGNLVTAYGLMQTFLRKNGHPHLTQDDDMELADHLIGHADGTHDAQSTANLLREREARWRLTQRAKGSTPVKDGQRVPGIE